MNKSGQVQEERRPHPENIWDVLRRTKQCLKLRRNCQHNHVCQHGGVCSQLANDVLPII